MCDFSLQHAKSRPAQVADKLETRDFGRGTVGFASVDETEINAIDMTAICVLPGTEIVFDEVPKLRYSHSDLVEPKARTARFRQVHKDDPNRHHDALEFADGQILLLNYLMPRCKATVLQLPAAPKNAEEAKEQERLPITA